MTFNSYITLDSKKYVTLQKTWRPMPLKPSQERLNLDGSRDVTYGPTMITDYEGEIVAPVTPASGYGSKSDLMTTIAKLYAVSFTDHSGTTYNVHVLGPFEMRSLLPDWDAASNKWYINVRIIAA